MPIILKRVVSHGWIPVIGMSADVKDYGLDEQSRPSVYFPVAQEPQGNVAIVVRTSSKDLATLTNAAREVLKSAKGAARSAKWIRNLPAPLSVLREFLGSAKGAARSAKWIRNLPAPLSVLREFLGKLDPDIALARPTTMEQPLADSLWIRRTYSFQVAGIGLTAGVAGGIALVNLSQLLRFESLLFGVNPRDPRPTPLRQPYWPQWLCPPA